MNRAISGNILRAIHERKWLSITYKNKQEEVTRYWIAVYGIQVSRRSLQAEGFHLSEYTVKRLDTIYLDSILSASVVEGSYYPGNPKLVQDMDAHPEKYEPLFGSVPNLRILNYLADCSRLDTQPYQCDYSLIPHLDGECLADGLYPLSEVQFGELVRVFQKEADPETQRKQRKLRRLCVNLLSLPVKGSGGEALYVLAYRRLFLDVKERTLRPAEEVTVCQEFTVNGRQQSIRPYLDPEDYGLLADFETNQEEIKDRITRRNPQLSGVDDRPYIIALAADIAVNLDAEYQQIIRSFEEGKPSDPMKAFFGKLTSRPGRRKDFPLMLAKRPANLDQLLAVHHAMKYPVTYVQGPPGTGKSYTIVNAIVTAFFHGQTVLLASYNNHPVNTVAESLQRLPYRAGKSIPFPVIRLGSDERVEKALEQIQKLRRLAQSCQVYESTLERNRDDRLRRTRELTALLKRYEEILSLREQREAIERLLDSNHHLTFQADLQGRQLAEVDRRLQEIGPVTEHEAQALLADDEEAFRTYLNFVSVKYLKRLEEPKNQDLRNILDMEPGKEQVAAFNHYLSRGENVRKFLRIFPVVATTCISAHKIGEPDTYFDLVILDEASQCSTATALVPILRGERLLLVGDPQQLNPVILLDPADNAVLKKRYLVAEEYDYIRNSVYKAFLANDAVSDEILLRHHYRCDPRIIQFNNRKYYNSQLEIESPPRSPSPLVYMEMPVDEADSRNTAPAEAEQIVRYVLGHREKKIGVITPFANQKACIRQALAQQGITDVPCGTVHAFQGDERDVILFSLALTDQTGEKTYGWLKNNRELINVATSRAREQLVLFASGKNLERLHREEEPDDLYELVRYVRTNGASHVTSDPLFSRALGVKPYSTATEEAFLQSLNHALGNVLNNNRRCEIHKGVAISQVFAENLSEGSLFHGHFDFVISEKAYGGKSYPILAIELNGKEHISDEAVRRRDRRKEEICRAHGFELIRVENSYARRYYYIKRILEKYFRNIR